MLAKHQIRRQATGDMGNQPGDCRWPFINLPLETGWGEMLCGYCELTYSLYHPPVDKYAANSKFSAYDAFNLLTLKVLNF